MWPPCNTATMQYVDHTIRPPCNTATMQHGHHVIWPPTMQYGHPPCNMATHHAIRPAFELQSEELPRDFTTLFDDTLFRFDTSQIPDSIQLYVLYSDGPI